MTKLEEKLAPSARTAPNQLAEQLDASPAETLALAILWSAREPHRVGEVALLLPSTPVWLFGRDPERPASDPSEPTEPAGSPGSPGSPGSKVSLDEDPFALPSARSPSAPAVGIVHFIRQRPDGVEPAREPVPVQGESISRLQLRMSYRDKELFVHNVGRCQLLVNGRPTQSATVGHGDTLYLRNQLLLMCVRRPLRLSPLRAYPRERVREFGCPDGDGMIGESPAMWHLRERLAAGARSAQNVLIIGESGSGKELAAQAIHSLSSRRSKPLVTDNISAIPPSLAAALLFGNKKNFPNPGMEERIGLIGAADGSMLFLDEIGDMPAEVQPMFLRVAERHGEYFRLGEEGRIRRSDFCLVGATNRPERMRYELKRRFQREIRVPSLNERKEDIPLLIRYLLESKARQGDLNALGFWDAESGRARVHPLLIEQLVRHTYVTNVSEVEFMLGYAMSESAGDVLAPISGPLPLQGRSMHTPVETLAAASPRRRRVQAPPAPERAQQALDEAQGNVLRAAAALGISRHQLNRMITRHDLTLQRVPRSARRRSG